MNGGVMALIGTIHEVRRALHGQLRASPESRFARQLAAETQAELGLYFAQLAEQLPERKVLAFARTQAVAMGDRAALDKAEWRGLQSDARQVVGPAVDACSPVLFDALFPTLVFGYLRGAGLHEQHLARETVADEPELLIAAPTTSAEIARLQALLVARSGGRLVEPIPMPVMQWARAHCARAVSRIDAESKRRLAHVLADGVRRHFDSAQMTQAVKDIFPDMTRWRARLIAQHERNLALNTGAHDEARSSGLALKRWLTAGDENVTDGCAANEAAGAIPIDEPFPSGDMHPPRAANPRCRCAAGYES